jgi:hypothetical protein
MDSLLVAKKNIDELFEVVLAVFEDESLIDLCAEELPTLFEGESVQPPIRIIGRFFVSAISYMSFVVIAR